MKNRFLLTIPLILSIILVVVILGSRGSGVYSSNSYISVISGRSSYIIGTEVSTLRTPTSKTYLVNILPDGRRQYRLESHLGAIHYLDTSGNYQNIDQTYQEVDTGAFAAKFTRLPYQVRIGNDSYRRIYPDRNDLSYWIGIGKPFPSMGVPTKQGNTWTWDFANAALAVTMGNNTVKLGATLKNSQAPTSLTFPFQTEGITRTGANLYHNGTLVATLAKPFAVDALGIERDLTVTWGAGTVTISLDTAGLNYPIDVDPTVDLDVTASADDAYYAHTDGTGWLITATTGYIGRSYSQFPGVAFRFTGANITTGSTINTSYVTMKSVGNYSNVANADIFVENATNPAVFSTWVDFAARTWTAQVDWDAVESWVTAGLYNTPSLNTAVQAVVDTKDMDEIVVKIQGLTSTSSEGLRRMWMIDSGDASKVPAALYIEYTEGGGASISNTPGGKAFGIVAQSSSYWSNNSTPTFPLDDGECYFTVTNNGTGSVNITAKGTPWTGGVNWTLTSGSPGENTIRVKVGKSGDANEASMVTLTTSDQSFITGLGASSSIKWEIKLETGTFTDGVFKQGTITLTATSS